MASSQVTPPVAPCLNGLTGFVGDFGFKFFSVGFGGSIGFSDGNFSTGFFFSAAVFGGGPALDGALMAGALIALVIGALLGMGGGGRGLAGRPGEVRGDFICGAACGAIGLNGPIAGGGPVPAEDEELCPAKRLASLIDICAIIPSHTDVTVAQTTRITYIPQHRSL